MAYNVLQDFPMVYEVPETPAIAVLAAVASDWRAALFSAVAAQL